jgi:hypothetical protein
MRPLPFPPAAETDADALEMIRGWIIHGELNISLAAWVWTEEPQTWGRMLAEAAGHLADAISKETGKARNAVFAEIRTGLVTYLNDLPDTLNGEFADEDQ